MKTIKTADLTGAALDWAVAKAEGPSSVATCYYDDAGLPQWLEEAEHNEWTPSTNWAQGGPIIEREFIQFRPTGPVGARWWIACPADAPYWEQTCEGETPLIAAMRCFVASKLGDEVEVPEELL